jgi:hypothetical protein
VSALREGRALLLTVDADDPLPVHAPARRVIELEGRRRLGDELGAAITAAVPAAGELDATVRQVLEADFPGATRRLRLERSVRASARPGTFAVALAEALQAPVQPAQITCAIAFDVLAAGTWLVDDLASPTVEIARVGDALVILPADLALTEGLRWAAKAGCLKRLAGAAQRLYELHAAEAGLEEVAASLNSVAARTVGIAPERLATIEPWLAAATRDLVALEQGRAPDAAALSRLRLGVDEHPVFEAVESLITGGPGRAG